MAKIDHEFRNLCANILSEGKEYENKNRGVKRLQIPSYTLRHDLSQGFPLITNKKVTFKSIVAELLWFLKGDNDIEYLNENDCGIWNKDAINWENRDRKVRGLPVMDHTQELMFIAKGKGSVGQNYSRQWRKFNDEVDQIADLIEDMRKDIMSSRLKVEAWNPSETDETALPPCHTGFQIIGIPLDNGGFGFELHWNQRSVDTFLGLPFNIASYALLAHVLERMTGYKALAIEGTLKCVHFYDNQYEAAKQLLSRDGDAHGNCELVVTDLAAQNLEAFMLFDSPRGKLDTLLENLNPTDFTLKDYTFDPPIKVEMLAPKE